MQNIWLQSNYSASVVIMRMKVMVPMFTVAGVRQKVILNVKFIPKHHSQRCKTAFKIRPSKSIANLTTRMFRFVIAYYLMSV